MKVTRLSNGAKKGDLERCRLCGYVMLKTSSACMYMYLRRFPDSVDTTFDSLVVEHLRCSVNCNL